MTREEPGREALMREIFSEAKTADGNGGPALSEGAALHQAMSAIAFVASGVRVANGALADFHDIVEGLARERPRNPDYRKFFVAPSIRPESKKRVRAEVARAEDALDRYESLMGDTVDTGLRFLDEALGRVSTSRSELARAIAASERAKSEPVQASGVRALGLGVERELRTLTSDTLAQPWFSLREAERALGEARAMLEPNVHTDAFCARLKGELHALAEPVDQIEAMRLGGELTRAARGKLETTQSIPSFAVQQCIRIRNAAHEGPRNG